MEWRCRWRPRQNLDLYVSTYAHKEGFCEYAIRIKISISGPHSVTTLADIFLEKTHYGLDSLYR